MRHLQFDYYMQIDYSEPVSICNFTIKCIPQDNLRQKIRHVEMELNPHTYYSYGVDGLGNPQIYGLDEVAHTTFYFRITGEAITGLSDCEELENDDKTMIFRHPHGMNVPGEKIRSYFQSFQFPEASKPLEIAEMIMHRLHQDFSYKPNTTTVNTMAEEAFSQGYGVCQDYAHIFIALLHLAGIPARYVTGLLIGEGASHAWVEVWQDHKWYGFDPTNDVRVKGSHIKIGVGRDAHDCMINRGIMHGGGQHQTTKVLVSVKEIGENEE